MAVVQYCYFAINMEGCLAGENVPFSTIPVQILVYNVMYFMQHGYFPLLYSGFITSLNFMILSTLAKINAITQC